MAPAFAKARQQARPIPPLPPVTMTVFPSIENMDKSMGTSLRWVYVPPWTSRNAPLTNEPASDAR